MHQKNKKQFVKVSENTNNAGGSNKLKFEAKETHSPFPDADDMIKLNQHTPEILKGMMDYLYKEQGFRHDTYKERLEVYKKNEKVERGIRIWSLIVVYILVIGILCLTGYAIYKGSYVIISLLIPVASVVIAGILKKRLPNFKGQNYHQEGE